MQNSNSYSVFKEESPQVFEAFTQLIQTITTAGSLDPKTRQLIYIGIKASQGDANAVVAHVPMAKEAGATRDEIRDTILMTLTVSGVTAISHCLVPALETYENCGGKVMK